MSAFRVYVGYGPRCGRSGEGCRPSEVDPNRPSGQLAEAEQKSEAQAAVEKAMQLQPTLSIGFIRSRFVGMHEATLKSMLDSLRKAGVPE